MRLESTKAYQFIYQNRFRNLFISLMALIFVPYFLPENNLIEITNSAIFSIVLLVSLSLSKPGAMAFVLKVLLFTACLMGFWLVVFFDHALIKLFLTLFVLAFFSMVGRSLFKAIRKIKAVNVDVIAGALAGYLIIGILGSLMFTTLEGLMPGSLRFPSEAFHTYRDILYYTIVSMTTLGYGEITPVTKEAQGIALLVTLSGQIYLTVVIALLIGKYLSQNQKNT